MAHEQHARFDMQMVIFVQIGIKTAIGRDLPRFSRSQDHHITSSYHGCRQGSADVGGPILGLESDGNQGDRQNDLENVRKCVDGFIKPMMVH